MTTQAKLSPWTEQQRISDRFDRFHADNPDVYDELVSLAYEALSSGHTRYGIKTLIEVVRWHRDAGEKDAAGFRLNNSYTSRYARLIMENETPLVGFFETRRLSAP